MTTLRARIEGLLEAKQTAFCKFINSKIDKDLRQYILVEDILSETIEYAIQNEKLLAHRDEHQLLIFLFWKAKMLVCDKVRRLQTTRKRQQAILNHRSASQSIDRLIAPSPSFLLHRESKRTELLHYLSMIPSPDQRQALELVQFEGNSVREAAEKMGKSVESVKKLVSRGFANLVIKAQSSGARKYATTGITS